MLKGTGSATSNIDEMAKVHIFLKAALDVKSLEGANDVAKEATLEALNLAFKADGDLKVFEGIVKQLSERINEEV